MNRAGLINFWYYDEEEFNFSDGRLLLRGSNGSGKSVTMQSFIPLLLDANKSPERLDPFGSKARKMENYLLGEEGEGKDESLAYLYMEFKKKQTDKTLTIGIGFKAVRGKPLRSWGFVINDGRRIGKDFFLYKDIGEKIPLTIKELQNRIGEGGKVTDGQKEYMKMVNDLLFGFSELDEYEELIKLLVQLRSPKLSKDFRPTVIYEIMENSLQPLSEDDLRPMSEAIENMDNIKSRLEELKSSKKSGEKIKNAYDKYNKFLLLEKTKTFIDENKKLSHFYKDKSILAKEKTRAQESYQSLNRDIERLSIQLETVKEKKKELDQHDSLQIKEKILQTQEEIDRLNEQIKDKNKQLDRKKEAQRKNHYEEEQYVEKKEKLHEEIEEHLEELENLSIDFAFDEHCFLQDEIEKKLEEKYDFAYIKGETRKITDKIEDGIKALEDQKRKNKDHDEVLAELEETKNKRDEFFRLLEQCRGLLLETKEEYLEKIYYWKDQNRILNISDNAINDIARGINNFDVGSDINEVLERIRQEYHSIQSEINVKTYEIKGEMQKWIKAAEEKKQEIHTWEEQKDPEPLRDEKVILFRKRLEEQGIPHIPLYKAIDFKEGVSEEQKGIIEEALLEMGLLDALVLPSKYKNQLSQLNIEGADKFIVSEPKLMTYNLDQFLKVDKLELDGISKEDVSSALFSILIDSGNETYIDEKGFYGLGILEGKVSKLYIPRYIGTAARRAYRDKKIGELKEELESLEGIIQEYMEKLDLLIKDYDLLESEFHGVPSHIDLMTAVEEVKTAEFSYKMSIEEVKIKTDKEKEKYEALKTARERVYEKTHKLQLKPNLEIFQEAFVKSKVYRDELYELEKTHNSFIHSLGLISVTLEQKDQIEADLDDLLYDINNLSNKTERASMVLNNLKEQLTYTNYEEIKEEINRCLQLLDEIPKKQLKKTDERANEKANYSSATEKLKELEEKTHTHEKINKYCEDVFMEEYGLKYVITFEGEEAPISLAKKVLQEISQEEKDNRERGYYTNALIEKFHENASYLRDYSVSLDYIFEPYQEDGFLNGVIQRQRRNITAKVRGKKVDFYELIEFMNDSIEENENLLRESDRQLFEDILVKNISKKIKSRIFHSEKWVGRMNTLMKSMNTSSGLSFSLQWTSKKAETEEQLDTKELVQLLKQDANLMRVEDLDKLSEHFRSKIALARRATEDNGQNITFHSIMREILDYRKWFEFKLYFVKTGQMKKELTNNAFYQFSGGEKAMAMYVPLFSAVNARYEGGRKDCPRIISLDEAFAGVDEQNIRDMFRLLNELDLGYIMNSQILWGDYDTVPSLSISELIRPDNANFVTVLRYHWDGKVKELVV